MAGNYPDAPSWRMAYDRDGTQVYRVAGGTPFALTNASVASMNDEDGDSYALTGAGYLAFLFPELRDLDGFSFYWANVGGSGSASLTSPQVSTDTTNGFDGTWTTITAPTNAGSINPGYRTSIASSTALAIRGVRFTTSTSGAGQLAVYFLHLYGEIAPGQNPHRLDLWHPTLDERLTPAYFDWGNVPRSSSADRLFRVKNLSPSKTANAVRVAMESASDTTPSVPGQHSLSHNGGSFLAQVTIGSLAPGAISAPITLRKITPSDAVMGLWAFRVFAESTDWV
jgi:hypothetical protein